MPQTWKDHSIHLLIGIFVATYAVVLGIHCGGPKLPSNLVINKQEQIIVLVNKGFMPANRKFTIVSDDAPIITGESKHVKIVPSDKKPNERTIIIDNLPYNKEIKLDFSEVGLFKVLDPNFEFQDE